MPAGPILAMTKLFECDAPFRNIEFGPVFKISRQRPRLAQIDLSTVRDTLRYMKTDADRVPGLEGVSAALAATLQEIEVAERKLAPKSLTPISAKFLPARRVR